MRLAIKKISSCGRDRLSTVGGIQRPAPLKLLCPIAPLLPLPPFPEKYAKKAICFGCRDQDVILSFQVTW